MERGEFKEGRPDETWPEVGKWAQSVRDLKPICELTIQRESDDDLPLVTLCGSQMNLRPLWILLYIGATRSIGYL